MYFSPLNSNQLMSLAKTGTIINENLNNLWQLDDYEYESLLSNIIGFLTATNPKLLILGACYSKAIYNYNPIRFDNTVVMLLKKNVFNLNIYDDFYALDIVLSFCESKIYGDFLKISLESSDVDVREEAVKGTDQNANALWFKYYRKMYLEFEDFLIQVN